MYEAMRTAGETSGIHISRFSSPVDRCAVKSTSGHLVAQFLGPATDCLACCEPVLAAPVSLNLMSDIFVERMHALIRE
jgi:hypothetical protein